MALIFVVSICDGYSRRIDKKDNSLHSWRREFSREVRDDVWEYFMLVTEWPQSACEQQNSTHQHKCIIPDSVKGWVLHGLWPSTDHGRDPQFCQNWPFDWSKVQDLNDKLVANWPNLFADTSKTSFWQHEYTKHGTCAASVHGFETEHEFFQMTLELKDKYDPQRVLSEHGIVPGDTPYQGLDIKNALNNGYNVKACAECQNVKGIGYVLLGSYVCLDKSLNLIDCNNCEHECYDDNKVYYHPMNKN